MTDIWTTIPNYTNYEALEDGQIRNKTTKQILKPSILSSGYEIPVVSLRKNNKTYVKEVRTVIAATFLGIDIDAKPKIKLEYADGNKYNNSVTNIKLKDTLNLPNEIWELIQDFEDSYAISNLGRVKRLARTDRFIRKDTGEEVERYVGEMILKPSLTQGYYEINLQANGKNVYRRIHRMVATAFIPNPNDLPEVNHRDGDKLNNCVDNLEWITRRGNVLHSIETGLRDTSKRPDNAVRKVLCVDTGVIYNTLKEAAESLNISKDYLGDCISKNIKCHGMMFQKIERDTRIKCLDTGEIFETVSDAERKFNVHLSDSINRKTCCDGWTFIRLSDNIEDEAQYLKEARENYSKWPRANKRWEVS